MAAKQEAKHPMPRERNYLEAWLFGWMVMLAIIAAMLLLMAVLLGLCGSAASALQLLGIAALLAALAGGFWWLARLAANKSEG